MLTGADGRMANGEQREQEQRPRGLGEEMTLIVTKCRRPFELKLCRKHRMSYTKLPKIKGHNVARLNFRVLFVTGSARTSV